jgi:hypothetical protein
MPLTASLKQALPPNFSPTEFREALGMFATGVTVVTARDAHGKLVGLTANSFNSVSLTPPLVLWSLARSAGSMAAFQAGSHYAVNILSADQQELAMQFSARGRDRFAGVAFTPGTGGAPRWGRGTFECFNRSRQTRRPRHLCGRREPHAPARCSPLLFMAGGLCGASALNYKLLLIDSNKSIPRGLVAQIAKTDCGTRFRSRC